MEQEEVMAKLTASDRKSIPKSQMGLPGKATKKGGAVTGSYPMPDAKHAAVAKAYAKRYASPAQQKVIDAKANAILGKKGKK
jgi:hypothetical protein